MCPNYPGAEFIEKAFTFIERKGNLPSCVRVLHKTLNLVISCRCFAENGEEMYQHVKHTCRASVLLIETYHFVSSRCRCRRGFLRSLLFVWLWTAKKQLFEVLLTKCKEWDVWIYLSVVRPNQSNCNHSRCKQHNEPIRTRSKIVCPVTGAKRGKMRVSKSRSRVT